MNLGIVAFVIGTVSLIVSIAALIIFKVHPKVSSQIHARQVVRDRERLVVPPPNFIVRCPRCESPLRPDLNTPGVSHCDNCGFVSLPPQQRRQTESTASIIEQPLMVVFALVVIIVILPIVSSVSLIGTSASAGLISMNATIANFTPIFGVGLVIGLILIFLAMATKLKNLL